MATALVGMGSNLGDRRAALEAAVAALAGRADLRIAAVSGFRETAPIGGPQDQPAYLNAALRLETELDPHSLLHVLQGVENELGRVRSERWGPRTVDLDLLLYDDLTLDTPELTLPHPRMSFRRFVLEPAAEVGGGMVHPTTGWTVARLLEHLDTAKPYVVVVSMGVGMSRLPRAVCEALGANWAPFDWKAFMDAGVDQKAEIVKPFAERLNGSNWPSDGKLWVSDCLLTMFRSRFIGQRERDVAQAIENAATPRLTIIVLGPLPPIPDNVEGPPVESRLRRKDRLRQLAFEQGPGLFLETPDFDAALAEAVAAVRAMG